MAKTDLGTKRTCPETGKKFYDLNKDPIVSPYTGKSYPLSHFESGPVAPVEEEKEVEVAEAAVEPEKEDVEVVALEEVAEGDDAKAADDPDVDLEDDDVELDDDEDDTFLADDDDDDDDVSGIIDVDDDEEES